MYVMAQRLINSCLILRAVSLIILLNLIVLKNPTSNPLTEKNSKDHDWS